MVILFKHVIIIIIIIINIIKKPEFHLNFVLGCAISSVTLGLQKGTWGGLRIDVKRLKLL